ncbi:MAG: Cof-type HAD-IIB family hydrolase [Clostridia bacterium]|nr:Cof-type HAD-IIB family hydrolase [Clostridia bacterium]
MKKFEGTLFCTDLDGTLFRSDKTVSEENLNAIEYFKSEGGLFTFITGRVPATSRAICECIHPNAPYGCVNGGAIFDPQREEYLYKELLPEGFLDLVRHVERVLPDVGIQFNTEKEVLFIKDNPAMVRFRRLTGVPLLKREPDEVREGVLKVVFAHDKEDVISALQEELLRHPRAAEFDFIRSEKHLYEILPKGVNKGSLLLRLAALLGIKKENTVAAGDYYNDVSMLRAAGVGFAVAGAVEEARRAADHITVGNDENAIAAIIDGLDRGVYFRRTQKQEIR